ncbi:DUF1127 domain-containing protein [Roseomonas sp. F4]
MSGFMLSRRDGQRQAQARARRAVGGAGAAGWLDWLVAMVNAIATRRHLAVMDDRMLKDIGISRSEALYESSRAPWDIGPRAQ